MVDFPASYVSLPACNSPVSKNSAENEHINSKMMVGWRAGKRAFRSVYSARNMCINMDARWYLRPTGA